MSKSVLLGIAAFGGLVLIGVLLPDTPADDGYVAETEEAAPLALTSQVTSSFPTYPTTNVANYRESTGDDGKQFYSFTLVADASIADINDWYRDALSQGGWSITSDKNVAGYQIIQAENGNLYTSMQAANGTGGMVNISQQAQVRPVE